MVESKILWVNSWRELGADLKQDANTITTSANSIEPRRRFVSGFQIQVVNGYPNSDGFFVHQNYCLPSIVCCLVMTETVPTADLQAENKFKVFSTRFESYRPAGREHRPSAWLVVALRASAQWQRNREAAQKVVKTRVPVTTCHPRSFCKRSRIATGNFGQSLLGKRYPHSTSCVGYPRHTMTHRP